MKYVHDNSGLIEQIGEHSDYSVFPPSFFFFKEYGGGGSRDHEGTFGGGGAV